ncbi:ATP-binding protein [Streptomyces sp. NPDC050703]|uniref:ATP-binding protein n=1 Tax=Streptomyces sp. NPDC050703 TaxID=3157218 RepID=UPI0034350521
MTTPGPGGEPAVTLLESRFTQDDMPRLRLLVERYAGHEGLTDPRRGEFVVAMDAVAVSAVDRPGDAGTLVLQRSGSHLLCRIQNLGRDRRDRRDLTAAPDPGPRGRQDGHGLWLARRLTDDITIDSGPRGVRVTLAVRLPRTT